MITESQTFTAFDGSKLLARGEALTVAMAIKEFPNGTTLVFKDHTGEQVDLDLTGSDEDVKSRYAPEAEEKPGVGRPKLGVVAREITLLPRHWDWLSQQPGGASVALRKLVEEARKVNTEAETKRIARDACYRFINVMAGNLANFEEASRALFADDEPRFTEQIANWPKDIRNHALELAGW